MQNQNRKSALSTIYSCPRRLGHWDIGLCKDGRISPRPHRQTLHHHSRPKSFVKTRKAKQLTQSHTKFIFCQEFVHLPKKASFLPPPLLAVSPQHSSVRNSPFVSQGSMTFSQVATTELGKGSSDVFLMLNFTNPKPDERIKLGNGAVACYNVLQPFHDMGRNGVKKGMSCCSA